MAKPAGHILTPVTMKHVLVVSEDPWLRIRLQRELDQAGCEVATLSKLRPGELADAAPYDVILTDAALLPEGSRLEAVRALRLRSPEARFVLLVGSGERVLAEQARQSGFDLVLERPGRAAALSDVVRKALGDARPAVEAVPVPMKFDFLLEEARGPGKRGAGIALLSFIGHTLLLAVMVIIPLMFTETLDVRELTQAWLMAPPPPPPPPPPQAAMQAIKRRPAFQIQQGKLVAPKVIPKEVAKIVDAPEELEAYGGVVGGVPGGVPGGKMGGVLGGVLGGVTGPMVKPPPPPPPSKPVRVGGNIQAPQLIRRVQPIYPAIAKQARIQGEVRIDAIIDTNGRVVEMKVLSGHPLLAQAALGAVQQWMYQPTFLNEQPIPVVLEVTVTFSLR